MATITKSEREELLRQRFILIPETLAREAIRWKIDIQDTVIEALRWHIHDEKKAYYVQHRASPCD
jgi:hypothetical protein